MSPRENNREHLRLLRQASKLTQDNTKVSQDTTLVKENLTKRLHPLVIKDYYRSLSLHIGERIAIH